MIVRYIKLWNIRSYVNEKLDFPEGSLLLSGDIGSGKSTILLSMEFALFGIKRGDYTGSSLLRNGCEEGSVEMKFSIDNGDSLKDIIVYRKLKRGAKSVSQSSGYIAIDGQKMELTPVELRSKVLEILGYPDSLVSKSRDLIYRYTVYTPQEDMKAILFSDKEERLDTLRRIFNIDRYKRVRENLQVIMKDYKTKINFMEGSIEDLPEKSKERKRIVSEANELTRHIKSLIPSIKENEEARKTLKEGISSLEDQAKHLSELKNKLEYHEKDINNKKSQVKELSDGIAKIEKEKSVQEKKIPEIDDTIDYVSELEKLEEKIEKKENEYNERSEKDSVLKSRITEMKKKIDSLEEETKSKRLLEKELNEKRQEIKNVEVVMKQKPSIEKDIEKVEEIIARLNNDLAEIGVKFTNADKMIESISELSDCPTCHQKVTEKHRKEVISAQKEIKKKAKSEKKEIESSIDNYKQRLERSKNNLKNIIEKEKDLERLKAEAQALENNIKEFDSKRKELEAERKKLEDMKKDVLKKEDFDNISKEISQLKKERKDIYEKQSKVKEKKHMMESIKEKESRIRSDKEKIDSLNAEMKKMDDEKKDMEKEMEGLKKVKTDLDQKKSKLEKIEAQDKELMLKKTKLMSQRESLIKTKDALDEEILKKRDIKEKMEKTSELKDWLSSYFSSITLEIEKAIMSRIFSEFDELFKEWFNILIEDEVINVRLDEQFTPIVEQNGHDVDLQDLSGGEKTSCALAYRLALNKVVNDCIDTIRTDDMIILDEPTDGFSTEQLDKLRDVLGKLNISQVILVSHEAKIESFVDNVVRITKTEHVSSVSS